MGIEQQTYDKDREFYHAHLRSPLTKGKRYVLSMEFLGYLGDNLHGFYRSSYKDENGTERYLTVVHLPRDVSCQGLLKMEGQVVSTDDVM